MDLESLQQEWKKGLDERLILHGSRVEGVSVAKPSLINMVAPMAFVVTAALLMALWVYTGEFHLISILVSIGAAVRFYYFDGKDSGREYWIQRRRWKEWKLKYGKAATANRTFNPNNPKHCSIAADYWQSVVDTQLGKVRDECTSFAAQLEQNRTELTLELIPKLALAAQDHPDDAFARMNLQIGYDQADLYDARYQQAVALKERASVKINELKGEIAELRERFANYNKLNELGQHVQFTANAAVALDAIAQRFELLGLGLGEAICELSGDIKALQASAGAVLELEAAVPTQVQVR